MSSQTLYVSSKQAKQLLVGHWKSALAVECFLALCHTLPVLLWIVLVNTVTPTQRAVGCVILLWADLLLLSPLKAGKAAFYIRVVKQRKETHFPQLFLFFKKGYRRTVRWRLRLWLKRCGYWLIALLPSSALLFWNRFLQNYPVLSAIALLLSVVLGFFAVVFTEIRLLRYVATIYLLPCALSFKEIFILSKTVFSKQLNRLVNFYLAHGYLLFFPPLFYTSYAATIYAIMQEFAKQPLQHWKNHGKILSELYDILEEI